ncbi:MAG: pectinesterase family protein [Bacteroidales bacterium]
MIRFCFLFILTLIFRFTLSAQQGDIIVAPDGSGDFTSIQEAIFSVRDYRPEGRTVIFIKKGVYHEKIVCPEWKTNITLRGEERDATIITHNDHANLNKMGTFRTYTLKAEGIGFEMENLTVVNDAPQIGQAVALHVESDRAAFRNCRFLGFQDTVFNGNEMSRQYFEHCYIEGTTDFIFGPATVWFEKCEIHSKRNSYITAASTPAYKPYGYIFNNCRLTADQGIDQVYLGRPWRAHSAVIFMNCEMGSHIRPLGWHNWGKSENEKSARYYEYNNSGPGSDRSKRVSWSRELSKKEAKKIRKELVLGK